MIDGWRFPTTHLAGDEMRGLLRRGAWFAPLRCVIRGAEVRARGAFQRVFFPFVLPGIHCCSSSFQTALRSGLGGALSGMGHPR